MRLALVQDSIPEAEQVKIAFATSDNDMVDQHFGSATQFSIYSLCAESWQLVELIEFTPTAPGHNQDKLTQRVEALTECSAIYCNAIGMSAIKQLLAIKIKPVNVDAGIEVKRILLELKTEWQNNPDFWLANAALAKKIERENSSSADERERLADLLNEEWEL